MFGVVMHSILEVLKVHLLGFIQSKLLSLFCPMSKFKYILKCNSSSNKDLFYTRNIHLMCIKGGHYL